MFVLVQVVYGDVSQLWGLGYKDTMMRILPGKGGGLFFSFNFYAPFLKFKKQSCGHGTRGGSSREECMCSCLLRENRATGIFRKYFFFFSDGLKQL